MGDGRALRGFGADKIATAVIAALVAGLLATSCGTEQSPSPPVVAPAASVVVAAGDIADCGSEGDEATAELVDGIPGTVLTLGDNAYPDGSAEDFKECYDPTWGRFKDRTRPSPGNHEYHTQAAEGYFGYFGKAAGDPSEGYYSYDLRDWHLLALNSNCEEVPGGCAASSPQVRWLEDDLAANDGKRCTLAYMHHPRFSSGETHGNTYYVKPLWEALYEAGADVVLSAHEHNYERFAPRAPGGRVDPEGGIRQFVVGTGGGTGTYPIRDPIPHSEVHDDLTYGVLRLTLRRGGYEWIFVPAEGGAFTDSGSARCH